MRLKELRISRGITQEELAKHLNISNSAVGMYEQGRREPNQDMLKKMAEFFNVSVDYLIGGQPNANPTKADLERLKKIKKLNDLFEKMTPQQQELLISLAENLRGA